MPNFSSQRSYFRHKKKCLEQAHRLSMFETIVTTSQRENSNFVQFENPESDDRVETPEFSESVGTDAIFMSNEYPDDSDDESVHLDNSFSSSEPDNNLGDDLADLIVRSSVSKNFVNDLLKVLRKYHPDMPTDYRTLLQTPDSVNISPMTGGEYLGFSVSKELEGLFEGTGLNNITLVSNVDGVPVANSSNSQFNVITCMVKELNYVFVAGVFYGPHKPPDINEFLHPYVSEVCTLATENFHSKEETITVNVGPFIMDGIARAPIMNIKSPSGYYSCHECYMRGITVDLPPRKALGRKSSKKISFEADTNTRKRTDEEFRNKHHYSANQKETHHLSKQFMVIEKLPVNIIDAFPFDYMHCALLGETRHLLATWTDVFDDFKQSLASTLSLMRHCIPNEFQRKCREVTDKWKATECRLFLIYLAFFVLKYIIPDYYYQHFLKFAIGIRILCSERYIENYLDLAENLIHEFINEYRQVYPSEPITYLLHGCSHLANECRKNKCALDNISAFFAENHLQVVKKYYSRGRHPLQQIGRRIVEYRRCSGRKFPSRRSVEPKLKGKLSDGSFKKVECKDFEIATYSPNNVVHDDHHIIIVSKILEDDRGGISVQGVAYNLSQCDNMFHEPILSKDIGIYSIEHNCTKSSIQLPLDCIVGKCILIDVQNFEQKIVLNLLHW